MRPELAKLERWEAAAHARRSAECERCPTHGGACASATAPEFAPGTYPVWEHDAYKTVLCAKWTEHALRTWLGAIGVPPLLTPARFENFRRTTARRIAAFERAREFVQAVDKPMRPLCLEVAGSTGTGKSHLAVAVLATLRTKHMRPAFVYVPRLAELLRKAIGEREGATRLELERIFSADVLVLDDLGAERDTEFVRERLETVLHERVYAMRPMIVTTNLGERALRERIGEESSRRLDEASDGYRVVLDQA